MRYARDSRTVPPPELRKLHPFGKSPVVGLDGSEVLAESVAIARTLAERQPESCLLPAARTPAGTRRIGWLLDTEGSAMPPLLALMFARVRESPTPSCRAADDARDRG